jgi:hypothetical protein
MIKIKSRKEINTREKPFIGPNVATPGGSTACLTAGLKNELI